MSTIKGRRSDLTELQFSKPDAADRFPGPARLPDRVEDRAVEPAAGLVPAEVQDVAEAPEDRDPAL